MIKLKKQNIQFSEQTLNYNYEEAVEYFDEVNRIQEEEGAEVTIVTERPYSYCESSDGENGEVVKVPAFWSKTKEGFDIVIYPCRWDFEGQYFLIPHKKKSMKDAIWTFDIIDENSRTIVDCMIDEEPMEVFTEFIERAEGRNNVKSI